MIAPTDAIQQKSLRQELTNKHVKSNFDVFVSNFELLNDSEIDDLESLITAEFAQGLPNDTELDGF